MKRVPWLVGAALAVGLLAAGAPAGAQVLPLLDLTVTPAAQTAAAGDAPFWGVELTNNTTETAFFILTGFTDGLPVTPDVTVPPYDVTPFGVGFTLGPGATLPLADLFQTEVSPGASSAVYDATAEMIYDLYEDNTFTGILVDNLTAPADWRLTVQAAPQQAEIPEPGTLGLVAAGLTPLAGIVRRRRR
jgi:hypothetical protein